MKKGQKKTMSLKQTEANRNNGRKSRGPNTPQGKAISSKNAMKHGILSNEVVVHGIFVRESDAEFEVFREQFWLSLAPVGPVEEMLVDDIVTIYWRLRRALTAETAEIALSVDNDHWSRLTERRMQRVGFGRASSVPGECKMKQSVAGIDYLIEVLDRTHAIVEEQGELTKEALDEVIKVFGVDEPYGVSFMLSYISEGIKSSDFTNCQDGMDPKVFKIKIQKFLLDYIDEKLVEYKQRRPALEAREQKDLEERQAATVLPAPEVLDKILRYETTLKRQKYRAMHELERLQRMRKGEHVPAPLTMEVSQRN